MKGPPHTAGTARSEAAGFPRRAGWALILGVIASVLNPLGMGGAAELVDWVAKLSAVLGSCIVAHWIEERLYRASMAHRGPSRLLRLAPIIPAVAVVGPILTVLLGIPGALLGDDGTVALATFSACFWLASAALGTAFVLLLDVVTSAVLRDFRSRMQVAVLGLLSVAVAVAIVVVRSGQALSARVRELELQTLLGRQGDDLALSPDLRVLLDLPEAYRLLAPLFFALAAAIAFPAVLSACGKLAAVVMERLDPLGEAFRAVARGELDARVEVIGSREFVQIAQDFNHMAAALQQARDEIQLLNEELEAKVARRTRELQAALSDLQRAQAQLVETEKLAMLSRLTAGILHEVNSPLGALRSATDTVRRLSGRIRGYLDVHASEPGAEIALRSVRSSETLTQVIEESAARIEQLMDSLQRFVSLDSADEKVVDVCESLDAAMALLRLRSGIRVTRNYPDESALVRCYPAKLHQALLNILQNAERSIVGEGEVSLTVNLSPDRVAVTLGDTGRGIAAESLGTLFDFGLVAKEGGRMGLRLGLPSSKRWVEEIGGQITIESRLGEGTEVLITLPRAARRG